MGTQSWEVIVLCQEQSIRLPTLRIRSSGEVDFSVVCCENARKISIVMQMGCTNWQCDFGKYSWVRMHSSYLSVLTHFLSLTTQRSWRDGLVVKRMCCSFRRLSSILNTYIRAFTVTFNSNFRVIQHL